jgi:hypothetical protein
MPTPPRGTEWFRGPDYGYAIDEDHFLTRVAVLLIGVGAISLLIRVTLHAGRYSAWGLLAGVTCLVIVAATTWTMTRFGYRHLVLAVDRTGITLGPGLWAYLCRRDGGEFIAWRQISQVHLFRLDYAAELHRHSLARHHVRVTTGDGQQTERAMPSSADVAALERALGAFAPRLVVEGRLRVADQVTPTDPDGGLDIEPPVVRPIDPQT